VARRVAPGRTAQLQDGWFALMDAIETDARFSDTMQLQSAARRLVAARALDADGKVPEEVAKRARATLDAFLARDYDADARSAIVNSASWVYTYLDDDAGLRALLDKQIAASKTPYYYYPDIADLEEKAGHKAEALNWLERGYKESKGPATRFQWGALYLNGLLRLAPQEEPRIRAAVLEVLGELDGPDRIHARARSRLDKLDAALGEWAKKTKNGATLTAIGEYWKQVCAGLPETDPVRNECPGLLVAART
jgi:protein disulfide-isomerase